jgi:predicted dehydrogenase
MKKYRIALAGCGSMANEWVKYALSREDAEICALVDIKRQNAEAMAEKYSLNAGVFSDIEAAVKSTGANLVFDVTIPESHKKVVTTALELGCDVFGEKPMAASMEDALEMVKTAQRTGKTYAVMQNRRFLSKGRAFRELVNSGRIGKPGFACADFFLGPHFGGFRDIMESPLILDMAIHTFDQARSYLKGDPVSVYCHEFNPEGSWYRGNASAVCIFEFSDGAVFCYRGSWCAEGCNTSWDAEWRVIGSKGTAVWDGSSDPFCEVAVPSEKQAFINSFERSAFSARTTGREKHFGCLDEMFAALSGGRKAETDCTDNIKSMAMVFGAVQSAREGRKIILSY